MSGTVYTVASGKGGVGKTTTSVNLAVALWQEGNAVGLVDADIGMANLAAVLDLDPAVTLHDVLAGGASVDDAIVEAQGGNLLVLPGDRTLESFADADPGELRAAVDALADRCDYVIVDTGAGLSYEDVLPLGMADGVVLVTTPDPAAFGDTRKTMEVADLLGAPIRGLVVTRAVEDTDSEAIAGEIGAELLGTIPEDPAVMASTVAGNPLESHAPKSDAAAAYRDLAATIIEGDPEWLEAHATERAADAAAVGESDDAGSDEGTSAGSDGAGGISDETEGTDPDEAVTAEGDAAPDPAAGEAWAAANESPPGKDATGVTDIGDLVTEVGETDEAEAGDDDPREPGPDRTQGGQDAEVADASGAADDAGVDDGQRAEAGEEHGEALTDEGETGGAAEEAGMDGEDGSAEREPATTDDDLEGERASEPEDAAADRPNSTDESEEQEEPAAGGEADDAGDDPDETAHDTDETAHGEEDADDVEEPEESDELTEPDDQEETTGVAEEQEAVDAGEAGETEEVEDTADEPERADDADGGEASEEPEGSEDPEASGGVADAGEAGEAGEGGAVDRSEVEEDDEPKDAESRGGFFGWLGRLFG